MEWVRRVSVYGPGSADAVDLVLPAGAEVATLVPAIVELTGAGPAPAVWGWRLCRLGGAPLDASASLADNGIRDGAMLMLDTGALGPPPRPADRVAAEAGPPPWTAPATALGLVGLGAAGLVFTHAAAPAAAVALTSVAAAAVSSRWQPRRATPAGPAAVVLAAVSGLCALDGALLPRALLAAVAATVVAAGLLRLTGRAVTGLTAPACLAGTATAVLVPAVAWSAPAPLVGAGLAAAGMGVLTVAPRLSIALAGLTPPVPDPEREPDDPPDLDRRLRRGDAVLTGLTGGAAAAAALGGGTLAVVERSLPGLLAAGAIGVALLLRTRSHADRRRRLLLGAAGLAALAAAFVVLVTVVAAPAGGVAAAAVVAAGLAVLFGTGPAGPATRRLLDVLECAALVTVVPSAVWACGGFALVAGWR